MDRRAVPQELYSKFPYERKVFAPVTIMAAQFHLIDARSTLVDGRDTILDARTKHEICDGALLCLPAKDKALSRQRLRAYTASVRQ